MQDHIHKRQVLLAGLVGAALWPALPRAQSLPQPRWFALLYRANPDYVEVQIDTHRLASNQILRTVRVGIDFVDANGKRLGRSEFLFTDGQPQALVAGRLYRKFFAQRFGAAVSARGTLLSHDGIGRGGPKFDTAGGVPPSATAVVDPADPTAPGAPAAKP